MKRTALIRKSSLRRSAPRPWHRAEDDKVSPEEARYVLARDPACVGALLDAAHACEGRRTLDHVPGKNENAMGKRAPSDRWHLVALCWGANVNGWASANRALEREYLLRVEPR